MQKYSSPSKGKSAQAKPAPIYQKKPVFSKPSQFKAKGWTETVEGYLSEARQLTRCILDNRRLMGRSYSWHLTINVEVVQTPKQIADLWTVACRNLRRKGIVALRIREPTRSGKVHYHLIVKNSLPESSVRRIVKEAMPDLGKATPKGRRAGWHMKLQPVTDDWQLAHYVTKAKIAGRIKGILVEDYYRNKRLLFSANLDIRKYGTIGDFWEKSKRAIWQAVRDKERRIAEGLGNPDVRRLAEHVHRLLGGYLPLKDIERNFGYNADEPHVQDWIKRVFYPGDEDDGSPFEVL